MGTTINKYAFIALLFVIAVPIDLIPRLIKNDLNIFDPSQYPAGEYETSDEGGASVSSLDFVFDEASLQEPVSLPTPAIPQLRDAIQK